MTMSADADGHRYFEGMAVAHVLGGLDESEGRVFRSHLTECSECRAQVGELRSLAHDLQDVERDERRLRAAKSIETKRREHADEEDGGAPPTVAVAPRAYRLLALVAVLLLIGLAFWNFTLRNTLANQQAIVTNVTDAAELLQLGDPVSDFQQHRSVEAVVRRDENRAVLLIRNLESDGHAIYQLDPAGDVLDRYPVTAEDGRIFLLVPLREDVDQLVVTVNPGRDVPDSPRGERMLTADLSPR